MENFFKEIDNFIIESNKEINEKILGINYLEKLKFSLIEKIIGLNIKSYEVIKNFQEIKEYNNIKLSITFNHYNDALSKLNVCRSPAGELFAGLSASLSWVAGNSHPTNLPLQSNLSVEFL